ncbi:MAG TPA: hypothetical protein VJO35_05690 [Terriglobales bacterium]|nr:hypothetical protein [Terriglobales bacterium]
MKTFIETTCCILLLAFSAAAATTGTNHTVKAGGGGDFTTIQACATAMAAGDTCTVFAGTYNEFVTVPAGTAGNYKTVTVNGNDIVTVIGFTLNSHTKLIGNCPTPIPGNVPAAGSCGFTITNPSSPTAHPCVTWGAITDFYVVGNVMNQCGSTGMIDQSYTVLANHGYIRGNTFSYACVSASNPVSECDAIFGPFGDHFLIENNDFSHYTLGINLGSNFSIFRNNIFHDQFETEASGNHHTDAIFSEPGSGVPYTVEFNVIEGNLQYHAVGPNAKGFLFQSDSGSICTSSCFNLIQRYNVISRIGSGVNSPGNLTWPNIKFYNNTAVDATSESIGIMNNLSGMTNASQLNSIYYSSGWPGSGNTIYTCGSNCTPGYNLFFCSGTCQGASFPGNTGNKNANPNFVNYISAGNPRNDYHLQAGSPAIAAGTYLTTVASGDSRSGTSLVVNDASYFQDGYGLSNAYSAVNGDCIAVGTASNHVCVTAVNYATNTLTLASSISRSAGQGVFLYSKSDGVQVLTGNAPEIGAYPYSGGSSSGPPPTPPSNLSAVVN